MSTLVARSLTMSYPGVRALGGVDFDLRAGEIHALCGENGAGKSTLIKILCGVIPHNAHGGTVTLDGVPCRFAGPADGLRAGVRVIHQELALCPDLTVAENIFLGSEPRRFGIIDAARMERETRAHLDALGLPDLDPRARAGALPVGLRQMVEIARALRPDYERAARSPAHVLILDEPTSALSAREASRLEETLRRLRGDGMALLYISHRLDEVFRLADRVTVLRNGASTGTVERAAAGTPFDANQIVGMMAGVTATFGGVRAQHVAPLAPPSGIPLLSVRNWTVPSPANPDRNVVDDVSFDLHAGEILGFAGLMGAGRTELVESLCGLFPAAGNGGGRGTVLVAGRPYVPRDAAHARRHGIALVGEDRRARGLFADKSVRVNMTISSLRDYCAGAWLPREEREREAARGQIEALRVKTPGAEFPAGNLSGGNQQKTLLARALLTRPQILILDEPTRGIDVGAKAELHALIETLAAGGMGILLISSETEEVLGLAHRVIVLRAGRAAAERPAADLNLEETLSLAAGGVN
jgi:ABC-type sugar transport system ATPase subunit